MDIFGITQGRLKELLHYSPSSGIFTWNRRPRSWFKSDRACNAMNAKIAGKVAGHLCDKGYIRIDIGGKSILAHRLAWLYVNGVAPHEIDHIDGNRKNNAIKNLRCVDRKENSKNRAIRSDNTSGAVGVYKYKNDRWLANICAPDGRRLCIGVFRDFEDAVLARRVAEKCFGYHKNHGRNPNG